MAVAPVKFKGPLTNINGQFAAGNLITVQLPPVLRGAAVNFECTCTKAALGVGVTGYPVLSDFATLAQFKVGGNPVRTRYFSELWGGTGLAALADINSGGTVVYSQAGNGNLSIVPVLIGSAADAAQRALLTANTATTAVFRLPWQFSEPFRKEYTMTEALALTQARADGTNIGTCTFEVTLATTANISGYNIKAFWEYDTLVAPAGAVISLLQEARYTVPYTATGDLEVGAQIPNKNALSRVSLLTASTDNITRVVVKQGTAIVRDIYYPQNVGELIRKDYNPAAIVSNRFDIEFDENDDPNQALLLDPNKPLSITATLGSNNGSTVVVLVSTYGPL